jgi:dihydroneopterin aldolase
LFRKKPSQWINYVELSRFVNEELNKFGQKYKKASTVERAVRKMAQHTANHQSLWLVNEKNQKEMAHIHSDGEGNFMFIPNGGNKLVGAKY